MNLSKLLQHGTKLLPHYANAVGNFIFPALTGEVAFVLWLLIRGAKEKTV